jgi:DNA helicase-2/ATP-dependent DNA helicase PcrA
MREIFRSDRYESHGRPAPEHRPDDTGPYRPSHAELLDPRRPEPPAPDLPSRAQLNNSTILDQPRRRVRLNDAQRQAVESDAKRLLINAGPGSGKTEVLGQRIALIARDVSPKRIAGLCFGYQASIELAERVHEHCSLDFPNLGTCHSLGYEVVRSPEVAEFFGRTSQCRTVERKDAYRIIRASIQAHGSAESIDAKTAFTRIDRWKNDGITTTIVEDLEAERFKTAMDAAVKRRDLSEQQLIYDDYAQTKDIIPVYLDYEQALRDNNLIDFADMILMPVVAFHARPDVRYAWQDHLDAILVDEYQDTNTVTYDFIRFLVRPDASLTCCGDDDQGIFGWRGADIRNILMFREDFPDATEVKLEQNYRSTQLIIDLANIVVGRLQHRLGKSIWSERKTGPKPVLRVFADEIDEARWIAQDVQAALDAGSVMACENAVLVRVNRMTRSLESAFAHRNIPYVVVGKSFYDQEEIRDLVAYLELAHDPNDIDAFLRIVNKPRREIGKYRLDMIMKRAREKGLPPHVALRELAEDGSFPRKVSATATQFARAVDGWHANVKEGWSLRNLLDRIIAESDYKRNLRSDVPEETADRLDLVEELLFACEGFRNLDDLLRQATRKNGDGNDPNAVRIMTLHGAKGTEFERVYIAGFEQDRCPHSRATDRGQAGLDEERRLAYVGITRAKTVETLCQCVSRGGKDVGDPDKGPILGPMSPFIRELGDARDQLIDIVLDQSVAPSGQSPIAADPNRPAPIDAEFTEVRPAGDLPLLTTATR